MCGFKNLLKVQIENIFISFKKVDSLYPDLVFSVGETFHRSTKKQKLQSGEQNELYQGFFPWISEHALRHISRVRQ